MKSLTRRYSWKIDFYCSGLERGRIQSSVRRTWVGGINSGDSPESFQAWQKGDRRTEEQPGIKLEDPAW